RRGLGPVFEGGLRSGARDPGSLHCSGRADPAEDDGGRPQGARRGPRGGSTGLARQGRAHQTGAAAGADQEESPGDERQMKATTFSPMGLVLGLALCACSTPPKPRELDALEKLKGQPIVELARKRAPGLIEDSDRMFAKSREEWDSNDLENSRRDAIMGLIKLKTAIALVEQDQARARETSAQSEYKRSEDDYARAAKELAATNEQITLLQKLQEARSATAAEQQKLTQEQQRAAAQDKVAAAQLALKTAETIDAKTYAAPEYSAAADMLARGETELKNGNMAAAQTSAELAKQKADQAAATAKPIYQPAEQSKQNKPRDDALGHDAAGISGVTVRLERRGDVQRLVLPPRDLVVKKPPT